MAEITVNEISLAYEVFGEGTPSEWSPYSSKYSGDKIEQLRSSTPAQMLEAALPFYQDFLNRMESCC